MKFEEENCIDVPKYENCFVYFLLKNNEVVYVGQTTVGISRPMAHYDKEFDHIKLKYCEIEELNELENKYIVKYNPKYNKTYNYAMWYSFDRIKAYIRKNTLLKNFTITKLKHMIEEMGIEIHYMYAHRVITNEDFRKIVKKVKEEYGK